MDPDLITGKRKRRHWFYGMRIPLGIKRNLDKESRLQRRSIHNLILLILEEYFEAKETRELNERRARAGESLAAGDAAS